MLTCKLYNITAQLLQKLSITAVGKREKLLNVIKNPVTQYLPVGVRKIGEKIIYLLNLSLDQIGMLIDMFLVIRPFI